MSYQMYYKTLHCLHGVSKYIHFLKLQEKSQEQYEIKKKQKNFFVVRLTLITQTATLTDTIMLLSL